MAEGSNDKIKSRYSKDGQQDKLKPDNPLYSSQINPKQGQEDSHRDPPNSPHTLHSQNLGYGLRKASDVHGSSYTLRTRSPFVKIKKKNSASFAHSCATKIFSPAQTHKVVLQCLQLFLQEPWRSWSKRLHYPQYTAHILLYLTKLSPEQPAQPETLGTCPVTPQCYPETKTWISLSLP